MERGRYRSGCCARVCSQLTAGSQRRTKQQIECVMGTTQENIFQIRGQDSWGSFVVDGLGIEKVSVIISSQKIMPSLEESRQRIQGI